MVNDLITPEEIKTLRSNAKTITPKTREAILQGKIGQFLSKAILLRSGYQVQMTMDAVDDTVIEHLSVSRPYNNTDPADAEIIATTVLGAGWFPMPSELNKNVLHFLKSVK